MNDQSITWYICRDQKETKIFFTGAQCQKIIYFEGLKLYVYI
jgi:hypothetical protein